MIIFINKKHLLLLYFLVLPLLLLGFLGGCKGKKPAEELENFKASYLSHTFATGNNSAIVATVVKDSLNVPWELSWGPDGWIWFTEQKGTVNRLHPETGERQILLQIKELVYQKSRGLFSLVLHPDFENHPFVYLCYTYYKPDTATNSKVVRYTYSEDTLKDPFTLLENIPGETYHNGSRLIITPDRKLLITTGDAGKMPNSQNVQSLSGKTLRINLDGSIPDDNPFPGNPVWSWGHRNPQGLVYAGNGNIYLSDHGADNDDEVNLLLKGRNYGWPDVMGYCDLPSEQKYCADSNIVEPLMAWSPTIAPAGIDFYQHKAIPEWQNALLLGSLKGQTFLVLHLNEKGDKVVEVEPLFKEVFGRIRDLCISPEGDVYISTSNRDWHPPSFAGLYKGFPAEQDDRIIKLSKATQQQLAWLITLPVPEKNRNKSTDVVVKNEENLAPGAVLYTQYCSGCHQANGQGIEGLYPPLAESEWVVENKGRLIKVLMEGIYGPIEVKGKVYNQQMPAYRFLSDEQITDIINYIRQNFGNKAAPVSANEVSQARANL